MVKVYTSSVIDAPDPLEQGGKVGKGRVPTLPFSPCKSPKSEGV